MNQYSLGYPKIESACTKCNQIKVHGHLRVQPYYRERENFRLMLIGQDPTIRRKPERVKQALMLDDKNSQLSLWLKGVFGENNLNSATIYATNLVKCTFLEPPSSHPDGCLKFLSPYFMNCKDYLYEEIENLKPTLVITFGEVTHKLFSTLLDNSANIASTMKEGFTGGFIKCSVKGIHFDYSPCLHIQTFRVAETYGDSVKRFKQGLATYFNSKNQL